MKNSEPPSITPTPGSPARINDEETGLPGLHRWPSVYGFVLAVFVVAVVLLWWVSKAFS
ncbi:MAG TPA: hypothetical protein VMF06_16730 [Candidatus Limnocylindria bacterium]|nr:hypothetical protein [Candidatus Limnocylindria bacterium]